MGEAKAMGLQWSLSPSQPSAIMSPKYSFIEEFERILKDDPTLLSIIADAQAGLAAAELEEIAEWAAAQLKARILQPID